ncbi:MAG: copper resistance CopC family protein [Galactobacter sp.]|uniref:copper resistance CopC family protein n=1 Tax=Galactobacter sp. TaxID=2676125 RepID=UPI0025BB639A|nr:copper resistance CopC family protein [Galactobacter sp.]
MFVKRESLKSPLTLAAILALAFAFMAPVFVGSASAHSQLIDGDPRDGTTVKKAPAAITLTFNEDLQDLPGSKSNQIVVLNRDGDEVTAGDVEVDGPKMSRSLGKLPAGTYDVQWSALSADGHRISGDGNYAFTVTEGEEAPATSQAPETSEAAASGEATANSEAAESSSSVAIATKDDPAGTVRLMWIIGGCLVVAVLLGIVLQLTRKKKTNH